VVLTLARAPELEPADLVTVADLLYDATPDFYDLLPGDRSARSAIVRQLIGRAGTDMADTTAARDHASVVGAYAGCKSEELKERQLASLAFIARSLTRSGWNSMKDAARSYSADLPDVPLNTWYLARIAVAPIARRRGIGARLLESAHRDAFGAPTALHVSRQNTKAIAFYQHAGFKEIASTDRFLLMLGPQ
jgi:ribosomal protein S18 acetylase RimI-like enzyme